MNRKERRAAAKTGKPAAGYGMAPATSARQARSNVDALVARAVRSYQTGQLNETQRICRQVLAIDPNNLAGLHLTGLMALQAGRNQVAVDALGKAIKLNENVADLHGSFAEALQRVGRLEEAIPYYRRALTLDPHYVEVLYNYGNALLKLKNYEEALEIYTAALTIEPDFGAAINNRGNTLFELKRYEEALADFDRVLAIDPKLVHALTNRGAVLVELKRYQEGLASCDRALAIEPRDLTALANRGNALFELRRYAEAAEAFERLLALDPDFDYAAGKALYYRLLDCDWSSYDRAVMTIVDKLAAGKRAIIPFMGLNILESAAAQNSCAQIFSRDQHPRSNAAIWQGERYEHARIRVAYLSADFRDHPMAYLMAGLFEAHDKSRFETTAISFGPDPKDEFRKRLERSFDRFLDVQTWTDRDLARLLKELEIDIAVDLMGYTSGSRPAILALRPAPIQVNFLGFPGTMGAAHIDYIIADRFVIPEGCQSFYTEEIAYMPDTYWPTDSRLAIGERAPTRAAAGLPEAGFVFCCFNQSYKIAPPVFDVWMRLLHQVEGSVLWLVAYNAAAVRNLRHEAERRGIAPDRLVFAPRVPLEDYLARFRLADLLLDTLPYNAHTTASDALWVGLPVVTCAGSSFAGRVAGSLSNAVGLPELITDNLAEYEALALNLARDKSLLAAIRSKLAQNRETFPLFDTERFRRHIESAYQSMWERHQRGEQPAGFAVGE
jgi:predicted O-linked N-acetylglucosamine transferase (SPINDLY family)